MSSRSRQPKRRTGGDMRAQLIEAGIRLLEETGPEALQARRVAAEVGASTMTVYTHFEGMPGLLSAIVGEAFTRFGAALGSAPPTDDPVADFLVMGAAYRNYALASPQRYRLMFGLTTLPTAPAMDPAGAPFCEEPGGEAFAQLSTVVQRMIDAGCIRADPVRAVALRIWGLIHGIVLLELTGNLATQGEAVTAVLAPATIDLLAGMGTTRERLERSARRAKDAIAAESGTARTKSA